MLGNWEWIKLRNAIRAARCCEARRAAGLLPWGAKSRVRKYAMQSAPADDERAEGASSGSLRERLRGKARFYEHVEAQSVVGALGPSLPAPADDSQERVGLGVGGDLCFASGDPEDEVLWAAIDEDMNREREGWLDQRAFQLDAKHKSLEDFEDDLDMREERVAARGRRLAAEARASERCAKVAIRRLWSR